MSVVESIDNAILELIENLVREFKQDGFLSAPSSERKEEIVEQIAKLRVSMNPECNCKK